jgi:hypothetical protein
MSHRDRLVIDVPRAELLEALPHVSGDTFSVLFDKIGYKTLGTDVVQDQHLLQKLVK